jgi:hypothetical protein
MAAKVIGIILLVAGAAAILMGVLGIVQYAENGSGSISGIALRMAGGMFLLMGGAFTTAFAFHAHITRGASTIFKRLRGTRIDDEIARLAKLRGDGYITGEEYEAAKKKLLDDV